MAGTPLAVGRRLLDVGLAADAVVLLKRAYEQAPNDSDRARWLAEAQLVLQAYDDAALTLAAGLASSPADADLIALHAELALLRGSLASAGNLLDEAIGAHGAHPTLLAKRGHVHFLAGEHDHATEVLERSLAIDPRDLAAQSLLIVAKSGDPAMTTRRLKGLQRRWTAPEAVPANNLVSAAMTGGVPTLRVGYVSAAFHNHAAARVFSAALLHHDPALIETYCYATSRRRDAVSVRLRLAAKAWRSIAGLDDVAAARLIRSDGIDILVDLDGHFRHNRLGIFAMRAAPVQVSAWGYVPGPGTPGIDYLMTDQVIVPDADEQWFSERVVRLPCAQPCNGDLSQRRDPPAAIPALPGRPVRFGCFNRYDKLSTAALSLWAKLLAACPSSTLTLKDRFLAEAAPRNRIRTALARDGVHPDRVVFEPREPHAGYLAAHDRIDLAFDPFPVNGGATTLDALSQGVPVVTLYGGEPSGRIGASILTALGLDRCVCHTPDDYLQTAVRLARDRSALDELKRTARLAARTGFGSDAMRHYAGAVEDAYRDMWERHCRRAGLA